MAEAPNTTTLAFNPSTEGVTLFAVFISDVLSFYEGREDEFEGLFEIVQGVDLSDPYGKVPIAVYNDLCEWIETKLGNHSITRVGRKIGETVFGTLVENKMVPESATPSQILHALKAVADQMIQDPMGRGWDVLEDEDKQMLLRKTQTFNTKLQFGLIDGLLSKSNAFSPAVVLEKEVAKGDAFDEFRVRWK